MTKDNYARTMMVAGAVLEKDNKYLLVQEKKPEAYKLWNLPAGRVEVGSTFYSGGAG